MKYAYAVAIVLLLSITSASMAGEIEDITLRWIDATYSGNADEARNMLSEAELKKFHTLFCDVARAAERKGAFRAFARSTLPVLKSSKEACNISPGELVKNIIITVVRQDRVKKILQGADRRYIGSVKDNERILAIYEVTISMKGETAKVTGLLPIVKENNSYKVGIPSELIATFKGLKLHFK